MNGSFIKDLTVLVNKKNLLYSHYKNKQTIEHVSVVEEMDGWFSVKFKDELIKCSFVLRFHH